MSAQAITVVIPVYNQADAIAATVASVQDQTLAPVQIIVVDDGSRDDPGAALQPLIDSGVLTLIRQENQGVSAARNAGIAAARGEFVAFLDADDRWAPGYLARVAELIAAYPDCDVFASAYRMIDERGVEREPLLRGLPSTERDFLFDNYFEVAAISTPPIWTGAVVVRKTALDAAGGFRAGLHAGEDLELWAKLFAYHDVAYTTDALAVYRHSSFSWTHYKRSVSDRDYVKETLRGIKNDPKVTSAKKRGLRRYTALWLKIRASQFIRDNRRGPALGNAFESIVWYPLNWKVYGYVPFALLPESLRQWIVKRAESRFDESRARI